MIVDHPREARLVPCSATSTGLLPIHRYRPLHEFCRPQVTKKGLEHGNTGQSGGRTPENIVVNHPDVGESSLAGGLPVRLGLTAGEAHDNRLALKLLSLADRGYDADWIRAFAS